MEPKDFRSITSSLQDALDEKSADASARSHVRSVKHQIEAIERGDLQAVLSDAHSDVTLDIFVPPEFAWVRHATGLADIRRAIEQNFESVTEQRPEITSVSAEGETVVLFGRERGRIRATGEAYDMEFVERFTFRDGKLAAIRIVAAHTQ